MKTYSAVLIVAICLFSTQVIDDSLNVSFAQPSDDLNKAEPQKIKGESGNVFMREQMPNSQHQHHSGPRIKVFNDSTVPKQEVLDNHGNAFMDETTESVPQNHERVPINLQNSDVQIDEKGRIVPMINKSHGPVQFQSNSGIQAYQEMPLPTLAPNYSNPMGGLGTTFVPVAPGTIPGIRSMNITPGYYAAGSSPFGRPTIGTAPYGFPAMGGYGYGPGYYGAHYGPNYGLAGGFLIPARQTQYSNSYSQTSLTGPSSSMIMPLFQNGGN